MKYRYLLPCILLLIVSVLSCTPTLETSLSESNGWHNVQDAQPIVAAPLLQQYLDFIESSHDGGIHYQHHVLARHAENQLLQGSGYGIVMSYFNNDPGCSGSVLLGDNLIGCKGNEERYRAQYPDPYTGTELIGKSGEEWEVKAISSTGESLIDTLIYMPVPFHFSSTPQPQFSEGRNDFTWVADPSNTLGVVTILEYTPNVQALYNTTISDQNTERIVKAKVIADSGSLDIKSSDLADFPSGSIIQVKFVRGSYLTTGDVNDLYFVVATSSWQIELQVP